MSKLRKWIIALACGILALTLIWAFPPEIEPSYQGRTLSYWLSVYAASQYGWPHPEGKISNLRRDEASKAVRRIGTPALPYLMNWIGYEPSELKTRCIKLMGKLDAGFLGPCIPTSLTRDGAVLRAAGAEFGFAILGPSARDAVPPLAKLSCNPRDPAAAQRVLRALGSIGPDAATAIVSVMTNQQSPCQTEAILMTESMGTNLWRVAPALLYNLQHGNDDIAYASIVALRKIVPPSEATISALTNFLQSPNPQLREAATDSLAALGVTAYSASHSLTNAPAQ